MEKKIAFPIIYYNQRLVVQTCLFSMKHLWYVQVRTTRYFCLFVPFVEHRTVFIRVYGTPIVHYVRLNASFTCRNNYYKPKGGLFVNEIIEAL